MIIGIVILCDIRPLLTATQGRSMNRDQRRRVDVIISGIPANVADPVSTDTACFSPRFYNLNGLVHCSTATANVDGK